MSKNPFPGPQPYRAVDRELFYARESTVRKLANQILATASTTVYGPSGAGKSSLMQAGVIPALQDSDDVRVVRVDAWPANEPLLPWLVNQIIIDFDLAPAPKEKNVRERLEEAIDLAARRSDRPMLVYLDQIEQMFSSDRSLDELREFLHGINWLTEKAPGDVHLVLSLREDYLGRLRDFTRERPELSAHGFRVAPLSVSEMVKAMCQTARAGEPSQSWDAAEIRLLMLDVRVPGQSARDEAEVQTAFGQIVCRALFEQRAAGQTTATKGSTAEAILQRYLDTTLAGLGASQGLARTLLEEHLIDDEGHRRLLTENEARLAVKKAQVVEVLNKLDAARVLRAEEHQGSRYFEIGHDWLAKKLLEKRLERKELARSAEEKRKRRVLWTIVAISIGALVVMGVLVIFAWYQTNEARRLQREATNQTQAAKEARDDAIRASEMAGVRELLANHKYVTAALVLGEINKPELARGWRKLTMELLANGLPWRTLSFEGAKTIAWSPDHSRIAVVSADRRLRIWNADHSGEPVLIGKEKQDFDAVWWSPDGKRILASYSEAVEVLEAAVYNADGTGAPIRLAKVSEGWYSAAAWSPDGQRIALGSFGDALKIVNADGSGKRIEIKSGLIKDLAWSPDGKRVAVARGQEKVEIVNAESGDVDATLPAYDNVLTVVWSRDGQRIATGSAEGHIVIRFVEGAEQDANWVAHDGAVTSLAYNVDGKLLASASEDGALRVWRDNSPFESFIEHEVGGYGVVFGADSQTIYTASTDSTARIWKLDGTRGRIRFEGHKEYIHSAAWSNDANKFVTASADGTARIWNADGSGTPTILSGHKKRVFSAAFSPDDKRILTASSDKTIRVWNANDPSDSYELEKSEKELRAAKWSPDGKRIAIGFGDGTLRIRNADGSDQPVDRKGSEKSVVAIAWSPDGKRIAMVSDKLVQIWNTDVIGDPTILTGSTIELDSVEWSPDGKRILTSSTDGIARIWDTTVSADPQRLVGHDRRVSGAWWSPDGQFVVTTSADSTARVWFVKRDNNSDILRGHNGFVAAASFSPYTSSLVTASFDRTIRIWDLDHRDDTIVLSGDRQGLTTVSFSPDGKRILATSSDNIAMVWLFDYALLQEALNKVTSDCLTPSERERYLLEKPDAARKYSDACERRNGRNPSP